MEQSPVAKLVNAILLSMIKRDAPSARIRRDGATAAVSFEGTLDREMEPPLALLAPIVRRLAVMASLPMHGRGQYVDGRIHLRIGGNRDAYFTLRVTGHGHDMDALVTRANDDYTPWLPPLTRL